MHKSENLSFQSSCVLAYQTGFQKFKPRKSTKVHEANRHKRTTLKITLRTSEILQYMLHLLSQWQNPPLSQLFYFLPWDRGNLLVLVIPSLCRRDFNNDSHPPCQYNNPRSRVSEYYSFNLNNDGSTLMMTTLYLEIVAHGKGEKSKLEVSLIFILFF